MVIMKMLINYLLRSRGRVDGVFVRPRRCYAVIYAVDATLYAVRGGGPWTTSTPSSRRLDCAIEG